LIRDFGLQKCENTYVGGKFVKGISGGEKKRVCIAVEMVSKPDLLILDEPTSGLDMNQLIDIRSLIKNLGKEKTVIFSSHIMQEVQALCDRVVIINNGTLVADEPIDKLGRRLTGSQIVSVIFEEQNVKPEIFSKIKGIAEITQENGGFTFSSSEEIDIRKEIFQTAVANGLTILEMHRDKANMEDIFRQLTKSVDYV